jgi:hypothetical protein
VGRRSPHAAPGAITLALLAGFVPSSQATELANNDSLQIRWDNSVKYTVGARVKNPSDFYLNNPNTDDADRSFNRGDLITNRLDWLTEFDLTLKDSAKTGFRVSAAGWYDNVYRRSHRPVPADTYNASSVSNTEFTSYARRWAGQGADLLDAFVHTGFDLDGHNLGVRLGRHTLMWGESLLLSNNGIAAAQAPLDVQKVLTVPGLQTKDFLMPVNQLSGSFSLTNQWDLAAYHQLEFRNSRIPAPGTFFSPSDVVFDGAESIVAVPGVFNIPRTATQEPPKRKGQWGIAAKFRDPSLPWDLGLYYLRYTAKTPQLYTQLASAPPPAFFTPSGYFFVYPQNIELFGVSTSGHVGDANVAGEISIRNNVPLVSSNSALSVPPGSPADGDRNPLYAVGRSLHFQVSTIWSVPRTALWDGGDLVAEVGGNTLLNVTKNEAARDPNTSRTSLLAAVSFEPTWYQVFPDIDLSLPLNLQYNFNKRTPVVIGDARGGNLSIGLKFKYLQNIKGGLSYTHYVGPDSNTPWGDRDFVTLNINYSF